MAGIGGSPDVPCVQASYHGLSHHGKDPEKLANLRIVEIEVMKTVAGFIDRLAALKDSDGVSVFDRTSIVLGSNMGNASRHATDNLPVLLAGGGYCHRGHVALDRENNTPLCNVYVTIPQKRGIKVDQFASKTGTFDLA